jgi:hypothetical protein
MNVSLLVLPSRRRILLRSLGYALGCGSAAGALTALLGAAVLAGLEQNVSLLPLTLVLAPIAAAVGAVASLPCGLIAGLALVALRRRVGFSRAAVRLVAGAGAALLPAIWTGADLADLSSMARPALLFAALGPTAVVFALAACYGPRALYGRPGRRVRSGGGERPDQQASVSDSARREVASASTSEPEPS